VTYPHHHRGHRVADGSVIVDHEDARHRGWIVSGSL